MIRPINSASMFLLWYGIPSPLLAKMSRAFAQVSPFDCFPASPRANGGESRGDNPSPKNTMTKNQFTALCAEFTIDPAIALENEIIRKALLERKSGEQIRSILKSQF
jgi:hypothetical protein